MRAAGAAHRSAVPRRVSERASAAILFPAPSHLIRPISSPARCGPHSVAAAAADVVDAVAELGRPPDVVIGHSFGGKVVAGTLCLSPCLTTSAAAGRAILYRAELDQPQGDMGPWHVLAFPPLSAADAPS
jgi:hypothetical protein